MSSNLVKRSVTGILFVVVMVGCILAGSIPFAVLFALITALAVREFSSLANAYGGVRVNVAITSLGGAYLFLGAMACCTLASDARVFLPYVALLLYLLVSELYLKRKDPVGNWAYTVLSQVYVAMPFSLLCMLAFRVDPAASSVVYEPLLPLSVFVFLWLSDTGAYCVGSLLGRHRLFERISPKKSWEGSIGGAVFAVAGGVLAAFISRVRGMQILIFAIICIAAAVVFLFVAAWSAKKFFAAKSAYGATLRPGTTPSGKKAAKLTDYGELIRSIVSDFKA